MSEMQNFLNKKTTRNEKLMNDNPNLRYLKNQDSSNLIK